MSSEKIRVTNISLSVMEEAGLELHDGGQNEKNFYGGLAKSNILSFLTYRQRQIVQLLFEGKNRDEIASNLLITEQAVNQIIPRIRNKLMKHGINYGKFANRTRSGGNKKPGVSLSSAQTTNDRTENIHDLA